MGGATSKGNEAKSKMKQPSDMPMPRFEHGLDHGGALGWGWNHMILLSQSLRKTLCNHEGNHCL